MLHVRKKYNIMKEVTRVILRIGFVPFPLEKLFKDMKQLHKVSIF